MEWEDIIHQGTAKDGRKYQIRHIHWSDLDQLLDFINSLVEAKAEIARIAPVTREEEAEWLKHSIEEEEKGHVRHYLTEMDHKVIGNAQLNRGRPELGQPHLASLGIALRPGYWDLGIGSTVMKVMIEDAKRWGLKIIVLDAFATNKRAIHVYEKTGFRAVGMVPKAFLRDERYVDEVRMVMEL